MKLLFTSLLAFSAAKGIFTDAADAADAVVDAPTTGLRRGTATTNKQVDRRANGYWAAPIANSGLTCIDNSIRAGGDKPTEICMTEGEALCIDYNSRPMGGRWQFGIKDSRLRLYDPKGDVVYEYCRDVTHLCIGEEHGIVPNRYSQERPYMTLYDEKIHEAVGSLTCDGTDGKDDKNVGESSILKLVDQADVGPYADFPLTIVKFRKGHTEDPTDDNSLWNITVRPSESTDLDLVSFLNYNKDKCVWSSYVDSFGELQKQIADATDPANQAKIDICPDSPIVFEDIIDFSDKYFKAECLGSGCVIDLDGHSFITQPNGFTFTYQERGGSKFQAHFEGFTISNGSPYKGRDADFYRDPDIPDGNKYGGAFFLFGVSPADSSFTLKKCTLYNNTASRGAVFTAFNAAADTTESIFRRNKVVDSGGVAYAQGNASLTFKDSRFEHNTAKYGGGVIETRASVSFEGCEFEQNHAGVGGGVFNALSCMSCIAGQCDANPQCRMSFKDSRFDQNSAGEFGAQRAIGGAIVSYGAHLDFDGCDFRSNVASSGGAIVSSGGGTIAIRRSSFNYNEVYNDNDESLGGAILSSVGSIDISDTTFTGNKGTALYVQYGNSEISSCFFDQNEGTCFDDPDEGPLCDGGGAMYFSRLSSGNINGTVFQNNIANGGDGGAILAIGSAQDLDLTNCTFRNNTADNGGNGGAIYTKGGSVNLQECHFSDNTAVLNDFADGNGGAIAFGKLSEDSEGDLNVRDTIFSNNRGRIGGAIYNTKGVSTISGCHFIGNKGTSGSGAINTQGTTNIKSSKFTGNVGNGAGAIGARTAALTVESTLFQCNDADGYIGGAIVVGGPDSSLNMDDVEFSANTAATGGAVYLGGSLPVASEFNNCRFYQNTANIGGGGAIFFKPTISFQPSLNVTLNGCVFQDNTNDDILKQTPSFGQVERAVECGPGYDNCFCDANISTEISTNNPNTTCAGDGVGPTCPGCDTAMVPIMCPSFDV